MHAYFKTLLHIYKCKLIAAELLDASDLFVKLNASFYMRFIPQTFECVYISKT